VADLRTAADAKSTLRADPGPLGLSGLGLTTFILSAVNAGILSGAGDGKVVIGLAVFYGGIAQLLAGIWEFANGNTFGATAFSSLGAFWLSFAALLIPGFGVTAGTGPSHRALGLYLLGWAIFTGIMMIASLRLNGGLIAVFVLLFLTFLLLALGEFNTPASGAKSGLTTLGGWIGILTAIASWYVAAAGVLAATSKGRITLPLYPMS
jgi:succinate-acetate transporter protein